MDGMTEEGTTEPAGLSERPKKLAETSPPAGHLRNASRRSGSCGR